MKPILVASDLSARSDRALARAARLAAEHGAALHALHVIEPSTPPGQQAHAREWATAALARELATAGAADATITVVPAAEPAEALAAHAAALGAGLVVIGTHEGPPPDWVFARTTAGRMLRALAAPVLLVRMPVEGAYRQAVIGVDFSPCTLAALRAAHALAPGARFDLVHAFSVPFRSRLGGADYVESMAYAERQELDAFLGAEMATLDAHARSAGIGAEAVRRVLKEGPPMPALQQAVAECGADLLAIGTHGRSGLLRQMWGSVAEAVLDRPPCDVLVVRGS